MYYPHANLAHTYVCMNIGMYVNVYIQTDISHKSTCVFLYGCNHTSAFSDSVRACKITRYIHISKEGRTHYRPILRVNHVLTPAFTIVDFPHLRLNSSLFCPWEDDPSVALLALQDVWLLWRVLDLAYEMVCLILVSVDGIFFRCRLPPPQVFSYVENRHRTNH